MRLLAPILLCSLLAAPALAQEVHIAHCLKGCPTGTPTTNDLIIREVYVLSSNDTTKFADRAVHLQGEARRWRAPISSQPPGLELLRS